jgi:5'-methylthioadenosine phosphorylase
MSIVGMTAIPEAFLAREAEMCYTSMAHITDFDVWHVSEAPVSADMVVQVLRKNTLVIQQALLHLTQSLPEERPCSCGSALANALITDPKVVPEATKKKLAWLVGKYLF